MFCGITAVVGLFVCEGRRTGMMFLVLLDRIVAVFPRLIFQNMIMSCRTLEAGILALNAESFLIYFQWTIFFGQPFVILRLLADRFQSL